LSKIRVRLLGGFEVWEGDRQAGGFESQKVRALLAYLACNRGRSFSRDHLAGLLWPERGTETARHALRQAVYNLRSVLPDDGGDPLLLINNLEIGFNPEADCWLDVEAFEVSLRKGTEREAVDLHHLSTAAQLYRGELLAGFFVKDSPEFEEWLVTEQTRLREAALEALRKLIESYRRRGEHRFGVHYARRLVAIEPLSEEAHRELMRLFSLSGQRHRALAQYEDLLNRLRVELGVEPLEETRALYESILAETLQEEAETREEPVGPLVPLAGRASSLERIRDSWFRVLEGRVHLTLVTGEEGIGKTRLIKSFLDTTTSRRRAIVLKGRCYELGPVVGYQAFLEVLRAAAADEAERTEAALAAVRPEVREDLVRLIPELRDLQPDLPEPSPLEGPEGRRRLFLSVGHFFEAICQSGSPEGECDPLVLFLDDLQFADRDTLDMLGFLASNMDQGPIWILVACRSEDLDRDHPLSQIVRRGEKTGRATRLEMERLGAWPLEEIAASLVGEAQAAELAGFLAERSAGLPLAATELINCLWDEEVLVSGGTGRWTLTSAPRDLDILDGELDDLIRLRVKRLPSSTRRLASQASIMGQTFDAQLLQKAEDEHAAVVEIGLELLLRRWLVRQFAYVWTSNRRERDIILWAKGVRRGSFEFAHTRIRSALYHELNPIRRQAMHTQVADTLERLRGDRACEDLAHHLLAGGQWERALAPIEQAMKRALSVMAVNTARHYCDRAVEALGRLAAAARSEEKAEGWRRERERFREIREEME
jgi:DNA-binding SARP family transcriptional activator